ncbi:hypothetical protein [Arcticibacter tournemirensis]
MHTKHGVSMSDRVKIFRQIRILQSTIPMNTIVELTDIETGRVTDRMPEEIGRLASTPEAVRSIAYIQTSLDEAFTIQKRFFENR